VAFLPTGVSGQLAGWGGSKSHMYIFANIAETPIWFERI
jgi:hypothetical protein